MVIRSFLPVGQGAFYTESFTRKEDRDITIVYDCGSATDALLVRNEIINHFEENEVIDAVFISHFDDDHINGLPYLLQHCDVRNLFFPLLTTEEIIIHQLMSLSTNGEDGTSYLFLKNPYTFFKHYSIKNRPRLIQIGSSQEGDNSYNGIEAQRIQSSVNVFTQRYFPLDAHCCDSKGENKWELIPFSFRREEKAILFIDAILNVLQMDTLPSSDILADIYVDYKDQIKDAFSQIPGSTNINSMTLFSGIRNFAFFQALKDEFPIYKHCFGCANCKYYDCSPPPYSYPSGCLYTGDYDASGMRKWKDLKHAYNDYWHYIGCLQIPHHGSHNNYNHEFCDCFSHIIISAGVNNKYGHPDTDVVKDLLVNCRNIHLVTEKKWSQVKFLCNFHIERYNRE